MDLAGKTTARVEKKSNKKITKKKVGRLVVEKESEVEDRNRALNKAGRGVEEVEKMVIEKVNDKADATGKDEEEGGMKVGGGEKLNQDQQLTLAGGDEVKEYPCPNCYNMFPSVEILTNHFKNCYVIKQEAGEEVANDAKRMNAADPSNCGACGKVFFTLFNSIVNLKQN